MRWAYDALARQPGTEHGAVLPMTRDADGTIRLAQPNALREGLDGILDLLAGG